MEAVGLRRELDEDERAGAASAGVSLSAPAGTDEMS